MDLLRAFMAAVPESATSVADRGQLESLATRWLEDARRAWPNVRVDGEAFITFAARKALALPSRCASEPPSAATFDARIIADLYLVFGCLQGDETAASLLETSYIRKLAHTLRRGEVPSEVVDDVLGKLREQLFVGTPGNAPLLARFGGRGDLASWLRISAVRLMLKHRRRHGRDVRIYDDMLQVMEASLVYEPELDPLRHEFRQRFKDSFRAAFAALPAEDRMLLLQHYVDGLTTEQLGRLLHLHRVSVSRRLAAARRDLLARLRQTLIAVLGIRPSECDSMIRAFRSVLDISLVQMASNDR